MAEWYERTSWSDKDEIDFFEKLKKQRARVSCACGGWSDRVYCTMKNSLKVLAFLLVVSPLAIILVGCGGNNRNIERFELVSVEFNSESHFNRNWKYVAEDMPGLFNTPDPIRLVFNGTFRNSRGEDVVREFEAFEGFPTIWVSVIEGQHEHYRLTVNIPQIDNNAVARNVMVPIEFSQFAGSHLTTSGLTVNVPFDIVRDIRGSLTINTEKFDGDFQQGDELCVEGLYINVPYANDTTELIPLNEVLTMPRFRGTRVNGFDTSTLGLNQTMQVSITIQGRGGSGFNVRYNVLPDDTWTLANSHAMNFFLQDGMSMSTTSSRGKPVTEITMCDATVQMIRDTNFTYTLLNPGPTQFQNFINQTITQQRPVSAFNALLPANQTATVTTVTTIRGRITSIEYELRNDNDAVVSRNLKLMIRTGGDGINQQTVATITVQNREQLTEQQHQLIIDFVSLMSFN